MVAVSAGASCAVNCRSPPGHHTFLLSAFSLFLCINPNAQRRCRGGGRGGGSVRMSNRSVRQLRPLEWRKKCGRCVGGGAVHTVLFTQQGRAAESV